MKKSFSMPAWLYALILLPLIASFVLFKMDKTPDNTTELVSMIKPGTVLIENKIDTANGGIGTGFILKDNVIVTNNHVIEGKGKITVVSSNSSRRYDAEVVHTDSIVDLAVIKLKDWDKFVAEEHPVNLILGNSEEAKEGSKVVVVGHPWGLTWTVSEGIISSKSRRMGQNPKYIDQIDAKIFQGNSGGPIFNEDGEIVCVSELMLTGEGGSYGFCIPSNLVKKVLNDFEKFGKVKWRAINVQIGLTEDGSSVILENVEPDGAGGKAGLKSGDKILEIYTPKNHPKGIKPNDANDIITELSQMNGDDEIVKILIDRNGEKMMFDVKTNYRLSEEYTPDKAK